MPPTAIKPDSGSSKPRPGLSNMLNDHACRYTRSYLSELYKRKLGKFYGTEEE
jgi:hypothetical protein